MSLFLAQRDRYGQALATYDPFDAEPLFRWLDPVRRSPANNSAGAAVPYMRVLLLTLLLELPVFLFCLSSRPIFSRGLHGFGGLIHDLGVLVTPMYIGVVTCLVLIGRRVIGDLINELYATGVVPPGSVRGFIATATGRSRMLYQLHRLAKATNVFIIFIVVFNVINYFNFISDGRQHWASSNAVGGTLFSFLQIGKSQPNLAGIWAFCVVSPIAGVGTFFAARLVVYFACLCHTLATHDNLEVVPVHPDGSGGLLAVGQVALFLSLCTFSVGAALTGYSASEYLELHAAHLHSSANLRPLLITWLVYIAVGLLLFFVPLLSLRTRLAREKRSFLMAAIQAYRPLRDALRAGRIDSASVARHKEQAELLQTIEAMWVWPYDKKTVVWFFTALFGPLAAFLIEHREHLMALAQRYFGLN